MGSGKGKTRRVRATVSDIDNPVICEDGSRRWFDVDDELHRENRPAVEWDTAFIWYRHGQRHREGGPAVELSEGTRKWYQLDELHRLDGPAVEGLDGHKEWWVRGRRHRDDGPAVEREDRAKEWWLDGERSDQATVEEQLFEARLSKIKLDTPEKVVF